MDLPHAARQHRRRRRRRTPTRQLRQRDVVVDAAAVDPASLRARPRRSSSTASCTSRTPYNRVVALDPTTGKEVWVFQLPAGNPSTRGVEYWAGDAQTPPQIVFGSSNARLYSLDAKTGQPQRNVRRPAACVDLNTPEILQGLPGSNWA